MRDEVAAQAVGLLLHLLPAENQLRRLLLLGLGKLLGPTNSSRSRYTSRRTPSTAFCQVSGGLTAITANMPLT